VATRAEISEKRARICEDPITSLPSKKYIENGADLVLNGIVATLRSALGRPRAMRSIVARTCRQIGADAGTFFLLDEKLKFRGAFETCDRTQRGRVTSAEDWPNVQRAIALNRPIYMTKRRARGIEADWFDGNGIASCLCTPVAVDGQLLGIAFWDFWSPESPPSGSARKFAQSVARSWATAIVASAPPPQS